LSRGAAGRIKGGDRLPWVASAGTQGNFAPLATLKWQVHVYGSPNTELVEFCAERALQFKSFPWQAACDEAGIMQNALYLVRPDGYVALADPDASTQRLAEYFVTRDIRAIHG